MKRYPYPDKNNMKNISAYCPSSLSLIFKSCPDKDVYKAGSEGVGFTVDKGVIVTLKEKNANAIYFNGNKIHFPTVLTSIELLTDRKFEVDITSPLPLGFGFGISGASSLAANYSINDYLNLGKSNLELDKIAHYAEIMNKTGLGTVGTESTGGFILKTQPGIPVHGKKYPLLKRKIFAVIIDKLETPSVLKDRKKISRVNRAATESINLILSLDNPSLSDFLDLSYNFVQKSGLLDYKVDQIIKSIKSAGGHASMSILGRVVLSDTYPSGVNNYRIEELTITDDKIRLLT
jgi:pantoate kinase